jgi:hypothetical protein
MLTVKFPIAYLKRFLVLVAFIVFKLNLYSQCTDAGVCIVGKHYKNEFAPNTSSVSLGYNYGYSGKDPDINGVLNDISYGSITLEASLDILKDSRLDFSIPYTFMTGPLGSNNGPGDLRILFTKSFSIRKVHFLSFSAGGKLATGEVNSADSLPQLYMPVLVTNDLILGAGYNYTNYYAGVGYQIPFGRSANYITRLKRGHDAFFRAGFFERFNKVGVKAEILTIIPVQPASVLNTADTTGESFIDIDGSNEPQVNLLATVTFEASKNISLTGFAAIPFLARDYNYDGLKRTLTIAASVSYLFNLK